MEWLQQEWSPYGVGACIGVLSWFAFLVSNRPIGCSAAFIKFTGLVERAVTGCQSMNKAYYRKFVPALDWELMLVLGLGLGSLGAALLSGTFQWEWVSPLWIANVGPSAVLRALFAFVGGVVVIFGSRWAGGCTSGHSISGGLQLAASSWLATLCFFATGIVAAFFVHKLL